MYQQNPAQIEQQELAGLEERYQWTRGQLESKMPTNRPATLGEIQHAANYTQQLVDWFRTHYGPKADSLRAAGFAKLARRLNAIIADLQQAHATFVSMYQQKLQPPTPPSPVAPPNLAGSLGPSPSDRSYANLSERCVHCNYLLGDMYWKLKICPNCGLLLRPGSMF